MTQVKMGNKVKVHYEGLLSDGTVFDSSFERDPIEFIIGREMIIPGFENAVIGMEAGESKMVTIPPEDAFGEHNKDLLVDIETTSLPPDIDPKLGMRLEVRSQEETPRYFTIVNVAEDSITLDGNHPLAGQELTFKIELLEIL